MSLSENEMILQLIAEAKERAATEVGSWFPVEIDDHVAGRVIEVGSLFTDFNARNPRRPSGLQINEYATTTIQTIGEWRMEGNTSNERALLRITWLGAMPEAAYERYMPMPDDFVAMHYQKLVTPRSGLNDYKLAPAVIIDGRTQKAKLPVRMSYVVPTEADLRLLSSMAEGGRTVDADGVVTPDMAAYRAAHEPERPAFPPFPDEPSEVGTGANVRRAIEETIAGPPPPPPGTVDKDKDKGKA